MDVEELKTVTVNTLIKVQLLQAHAKSMDVEELKTVTVNTLIKVQLLQALLMLKVWMLKK